jgi:hypothetical protein
LFLRVGGVVVVRDDGGGVECLMFYCGMMTAVQ